MITAFLSSDIHYRIRQSNRYDYLDRNISTEIDELFTYYQNRLGRVTSNHFIARIIKWFDVLSFSSIPSLLLYLEDSLPFVERHFNITSSVSRGNGQYISVSLNRDYFSRSLEIIRPLFTTRTDFGYGFIPLGSDILAIDIKALILNYFYWSRGLTDPDPSIFIYQIVLPSMSRAYFTLSVLNRILYQSDYTISTHPLMTRTFENTLLDYTKEITSFFIGKKVFVEQVLDQLIIPSGLTHTFREYLQIDWGVETSYNRWLITIIQMYYIVRILELIPDAITKNYRTVYEIRQSIRLLRGDAMLQNTYKDFYQSILTRFYSVTDERAV